MNHALHPLDIIIKKRDGHELTQPEIEHFIHAVVLNGEQKLAGANAPQLSASDKVSDAQIASFLMAVFQRGLSPRELADLTTAMRYSGETLDASSLNTFTVDKHSTGGMLDKLETIPGFDTQLPLARMTEVLRETHAALVGQTPRLVPADRILYAMRDHTGTVESPFLICASIMSKKLAEDIRALVLDVKVGSGAFMPTYDASKYLATLMVETGELAGTRTAALLTTMDEPLGRFSGNWIEVWECVDIMRAGPDPAKRHPMSRDLIELSNILSGWMLFLAGKSASPEAGAELADDILRSGQAYKSWLQIVERQGGDIGVFDDPAAFHKPQASRVLKASRAGYLSAMDCKEVGWAVQRLGAGRAKPGDPVSAHAGIESHAKLGAKLEAGQPIFTLFSEDAALLDEPYRMLEATIQIADAPPERQPLIREIITKKTS